MPHRAAPARRRVSVKEACKAVAAGFIEAETGAGKSQKDWGPEGPGDGSGPGGEEDDADGM